MSAGPHRLDRFVVPASARDEFLLRVSSIHERLRRQHGFVRDVLLQRPAEGGAFELVTLVEWRDAAAMALARDAIKARQAQDGFDPAALLARLGIRADLGLYHPVTPAFLTETGS